MGGLAVFGGSFNPIHSGHLVIAEYALYTFSLDKVIFVPARIPPHKKMAELVSDDERFGMVEAAIADNPAFELSRIELERDGVSYSIDTMRQLAAKEHGPFYFLIGEDLVSGLPTWKSIEELQAIVTFIVAVRGDDPTNAESLIPVTRFITPRIDISSTMIRERLSKGQSIRYLVPPQVYRKIHDNGLYS